MTSLIIIEWLPVPFILSIIGDLIGLRFIKYQYQFETMKRQSRQLTLQAFVNKSRKTRPAEPSFTGFTVVKTPPDGNCMFSALAHQASTETCPALAADDLRKTLVAYIRQHPTIISECGFIPEGW